MLVSIVAFWVLEEEKRAVSEAVGTAPVDQLEEADQLLVLVATQVIVAACACPIKAKQKNSAIEATRMNMDDGVRRGNMDWLRGLRMAGSTCFDYCVEIAARGATLILYIIENERTTLPSTQF